MKTLAIEAAQELIGEGYSAHWLIDWPLNIWAEDQSETDGRLRPSDGRSFAVLTTLRCTGKCGCTLPVEVHEGAPGWCYAYATGPDTNGDEYTGTCDLRNQEYVCHLDEHGCARRSEEASTRIREQAERGAEERRRQWAEEDARKAAAAAEEAARPKPHCGGCGARRENDAATCRFCSYGGPVSVY